MTKRDTNIEGTFWSYVDIRGPDECWMWQKSTWNGYGAFRRGKSHRWAWEFHHKQKIPAGACICHTCDVPGCVNPAHLFLGTKADNNADKMQKGRHVVARGEDSGNAKLTNETARQLLCDWISGDSTVTLGERYGIHDSVAADVVSGRTWKHIHGTHGAPSLEDMQDRGRTEGPNFVLSEPQVIEIMKRLAKGAKGPVLAKEYDCHRMTIFSIKYGRAWAHLLGVNGNPTVEQMSTRHLTRDEVLAAKAELDMGLSYSMVMAHFGISKTTTGRIAHGTYRGKFTDGLPKPQLAAREQASKNTGRPRQTAPSR